MYGKAAYLHKLAAIAPHFKSVNVGEKLEGSSPPSVFVGSWGYPKVYAGPMLTPICGDSSQLDMPEAWVDYNANQIIDFRLQLIRGKAQIMIRDLDNKLVRKLQDMTLAKKSVTSEAEFKSKPRGVALSEDHQPFGPSALIKKFEIENAKWVKPLEKVYYDNDLKAAEAVKLLHKKGLLVSQIQKAFSIGTMGLGKNRKLVPTRWSITAVDDILGKYFLEQVRQNPILDTFQVYEFGSLKNYFAVLLLPTPWQYENFEAFIHVLGNEIMFFGDWEPFTGRKTYSEQGGCYYSAKFAIAEHLCSIKKQAGAIVFREAYPGYIPLGVWNVRENIRAALRQKPKEFSNMKTALDYIDARIHLPITYFLNRSRLLKSASKQTLLSNFWD